MRFDVLFRRSSRCIISCATSCASVANSSAGDWPGSKRDLAACRSATGRRDVLGVFESDALLRDEFRKALTVLAGIAVDAADCRQLLAVRLADIEHVGRAESDCR